MASPLLWLLACSCCSCCSCYVAPGAAGLSQSPDVSVPEGADLSLRCCWSLNATRFLVTWLKNGTALKVVQQVAPAGAPQASGCLNLTLTAVGRGAAGSYRCRVLTELPAYGVLEGPGTVVRVQGPPGPPAGPAPRGGVAPPLLGLVLRSLPLLALILAFVCLRRSRSPAAAPCEEGGGL